MKRFLHFLFIGLLLVSCQNKEDNTIGVYFAGEIVNPTDRQVVLFKGETAIDSIKLDENNRFEFSLDSVQEGLHHFYHHPELQYVYLENGDSLQARLNTVDFDESLVFSGKGEEINNLLLEIFLDTELEEDLVYSFYNLEPAVFSLKIDSLKNDKLNL
ncbi:MAG: transaldolase, partial [Eudoraea sp.]|nr:transaldolase [Eudoraea sp.]